MYLTLSRKNARIAVIDDDGWQYVEALGQRWERIDDGVWKNIDTGEVAFRQDDDSWLVSGLVYSSIKKIMLDKQRQMQAV